MKIKKKVSLLSVMFTIKENIYVIIIIGGINEKKESIKSV